MTTIAKAIAATVLVTGSLAACADLPFRLPGERAAILKPEQGSILFRTDTVGNLPVQRVLYSDNEQRVEYAFYKGKGAQAEFVYMEKPYNYKVAFRYAFTVADTVQKWNYSKGQSIEWDKVVGIRAKVGDLFYRSYRLSGKNQSCLAINGEWDRAVDDSKQRHTRIMFGYYCAPAGQALSQEKTLALIDAIGLKGYTERSPDYADTLYGFHKEVVANFIGKDGTQKAIALAQFGTDAGAGIAEYPFRYAEPYMVIDGNDDLN